MKKLSSEYMANMAQSICVAAGCDVPPETIKKCCVRAVGRLEREANDPKNRNSGYVSVLVSFDCDGKERTTHFCARTDKDFFDDSTGAGDIPASVRAAEAAKEERIRLLRLSFRDRMKRLGGQASLAAISKNPILHIDTIMDLAMAAHSDANELAKLCPKLLAEKQAEELNQ